MKIRKESFNVDLQDLIAFLIMMLITIFPVFGQYGRAIQNYGLWILGFLGLLISALRGYVVFNRFLFGYSIYFVFSIISIFWSINLGGAYIRLVNMLQNILIGCFLVLYCNRESNVSKLLKYYVCGTVIISAYCFIQDMPSLSAWSRVGRVAFETAGQNQIYYSCLLIYSTMILLYWIFESSGRRLLHIFLFAFLYICGLLTAIRKCLIIPLLFAFFYVLFKYKKRSAKLIGYLILVIFICAIAYYFIIKYVPSMYSRLESLITDIATGVDADVNGNSYALRKWLREQAWDTFKAHPVLGVGIGQFRFYASAGGSDLYSHNNFLEVLANTGIIGFLIYYGTLFQLLIKSIRFSNIASAQEKNRGYFLTAFLISVFVMEYGQVDYYQIFFVWLPVSLCCFIDDFRLKFGSQSNNKSQFCNHTSSSANP